MLILPITTAVDVHLDGVEKFVMKVCSSEMEEGYIMPCVTSKLLF